MSCEHVEDLLSAYLDNALTMRERVGVQEHVSTCSACREILADYRRFDALLTDLPRVSPGDHLHDKIFTSPEYLELIGKTEITSLDDFRRTRSCSQELQESQRYTSYKQFRQPRIEEPITSPHKRAARHQKTRPHLVALPGGLQETQLQLPTREQQQAKHRHLPMSLRLMQIAIAACLLLTVGIGGFIGWNMWQQQHLATIPGGIVPPLGPRLGGPLPAGTRYVFLHNGVLWSGTPDNADSTATAHAPDRLTPTNVVVASQWRVRPASPGRAAGNMLAYIDLKQGRVHIIRSDGQNDITIPQPLLSSTSSSQWNTVMGATILNSLAWSPDGSKLAFIAAPSRTAHLSVYSLNAQNSNHIQILPFVMQDELLSLNWSVGENSPTLTWGVGTPGHIHAIMRQNMSGNAAQTKVLLTGDYAQASYGPSGNWLLLSQTHDIFTLNANGLLSRWTHDGSARLATWSPQGSSISYFSNLSNNMGAYHILSLATGSDTEVATNVISSILPAWSMNERYVLYSDGAAIFVMNLRNASRIRIHLSGTPSFLAWNPALPEQAIATLQNNGDILYLLNGVNGTVTQIRAAGITGPVLWTEIP